MATQKVDAVVIGAGGLGLGVALNLRMKGASVAVLDRGGLASATSPRAAGLACQVKNDEVQTRLSRESNELLRDFASWTGGVGLTVHESGGIKVARTDLHADAVRDEAARSVDAGIECHLIDPRHAQALAPYYEFEDESAAAIAYTPSDLFLEPRDLLAAYIEACRRWGAALHPHTSVTSFERDGDEIVAVGTENGIIETRAVVDTCGAWLNAVARLLAAKVPLVPVRHQLCVTQPVAGVSNRDAIVRVVESNVYLRPDRGGLMVGGYEPDPLVIDDDATGIDAIDELPLDFTPVQRLISQVAPQVPSLRRPVIRELRGGLPTMTADGNYLIDRVPEAQNFFVVGGCNVAGLTTSPAIGRVVAELLVGETPSVDLTAFSISRFEALSSAEFHQQAVLRYATREEWD